MAQLIKPQQVKVVTKDGEIEVSIVLELNVNLNVEGLAGLAVKASDSTPVQVQKVAEPEMEWAIPDFGTGEKIKFGKE